MASAIWSGEDPPFFSTSSTWSTDPSSSIASVVLCCSDCRGDKALSFLSFFVLLCIRSCDLRVELALAVNVVLSGRGVPREYAQQLIVAGFLFWEDSIAYDRSTALLVPN